MVSMAWAYVRTLLKKMGNFLIKRTKISMILKSHLKKILRFEAKKPYNFDKNQKRSALSRFRSKNSQTPKEKKPRNHKPIKSIWLLGQ